MTAQPPRIGQDLHSRTTLKDSSPRSPHGPKAKRPAPPAATEKMATPSRPPLSNPRHERFAQAIARGEYADAAYKEAGFKNHRSSASRLLANASIQRRIAALQLENCEMSKIDRQEALAYLASVVRTPIGHVTADSPVCQEYSEATTPEGQTYLKVKMPSKIDALRLIGKWSGWERGTQAERDAAAALGGVAELVSRIRAGQASKPPAAPYRN